MLLLGDTLRQAVTQGLRIVSRDDGRWAQHARARHLKNSPGQSEYSLFLLQFIQSA
jgi:hypothetical protein